MIWIIKKKLLFVSFKTILSILGKLFSEISIKETLLYEIIDRNIKND